MRYRTWGGFIQIQNLSKRSWKNIELKGEGLLRYRMYWGGAVEIQNLPRRGCWDTELTGEGLLRYWTYSGGAVEIQNYGGGVVEIQNLRGLLRYRTYWGCWDSELRSRGCWDTELTGEGLLVVVSRGLGNSPTTTHRLYSSLGFNRTEGPIFCMVAMTYNTSRNKILHITVTHSFSRLYSYIHSISSLVKGQVTCLCVPRYWALTIPSSTTHTVSVTNQWNKYHYRTSH